MQRPIAQRWRKVLFRKKKSCQSAKNANRITARRWLALALQAGPRAGADQLLQPFLNPCAAPRSHAGRGTSRKGKNDRFIFVLVCLRNRCRNDRPAQMCRMRVLPYRFLTWPVRYPDCALKQGQPPAMPILQGTCPERRLCMPSLP